MKKSQLSQFAFGALLLALGIPFIMNKTADYVAIGKVSVSRSSYERFQMIDYLRAKPVTPNMFFVLAEEATQGSNPFMRLSNKIKLDCFGVQMTEADITSSIQSDKSFFMFGRFNQDEYNKFLTRISVTDPMYREYVRQYMSSEILMKMYDDVIEGALGDMSEYIDNICAAFRQRRVVTVRKVLLDDLPKFDLTDQDIAKTYIEHQYLFKTAMHSKVELVRCNLTKEKQMMLQSSMRTEDLNSMSIDEIANILKESVIIINIHGDATTVDVEIDNDILDHIKQNVANGNNTNICHARDQNKITYIYKLVDHKKSEVKGLENVRQAVIDIAIKAKQKEFCEKNADNLNFSNQPQLTFALIDVLPNGFLAVGFNREPIYNNEELDIGRAAFQLSEHPASRAKFIISNGQVFLIGLDEIEYVIMSDKTSQAYNKYIRKLIRDDMLVAFVDRLMK